MMMELHEVRCGSHSDGRTLAQRINRLGFYWSNLQKFTLIMLTDVIDAKDMPIFRIYVQVK